MWQRKTSEEFKFFKDKKIIIYGIGHVAMQLYEVLTIRGLDRNVECFLISDAAEKPKYIKGIKVIPINEYKNSENVIICIAVHEAIKNEIEMILKRKNISNYMWISRFFMTELLLGKSIKEMRSVEKLILRCNDYSIAVRYLAIEQYFGKNDHGFDIYKKAQRLSCAQETAEKRLVFFCDLIHSWEISGYHADSLVLIDYTNEILDGRHRVALAKYFQMDEIMCGVFEYSHFSHKWLGSGARVTRAKILDGNFTDEELKIIENAYRRVRAEG